jgi:RNA polymerase sigma factor (sigma-70 family)
VRESGANVDTAEASGSAAEVFASFYEQYMPGIYKYIHYRVANVHLAEDLTSVVFEKALAGFRRYKADRASFFTWLITIARHTVIDHYRQQSRRKDIPLEDISDISSGNSSPEQQAVKKEELQRLRFCLARLSQQEQEIISCKFGAEMNNRQVAGVLSLSESNVGTVLYRAVRKLRDCFREWQNGKGR